MTSNKDFGTWLADNHIDYLSANDRAALITMGKGLDALNSVLGEQTKQLLPSTILEKYKDRFRPSKPSSKNWITATAEEARAPPADRGVAKPEQADADDEGRAAVAELTDAGREARLEGHAEAIRAILAKNPALSAAIAEDRLEEHMPDEPWSDDPEKAAQLAEHAKNIRSRMERARAEGIDLVKAAEIAAAIVEAGGDPFTDVSLEAIGRGSLLATPDDDREARLDALAKGINEAFARQQKALLESARVMLGAMMAWGEVDEDALAACRT